MTSWLAIIMATKKKKKMMMMMMEMTRSHRVSAKFRPGPKMCMLHMSVFVSPERGRNSAFDFTGLAC